MISNIGFNKNASHTLDFNNSIANTPLENFTAMIHPGIMIPNIDKDIRQLKNEIPSPFTMFKQMIKRLKKIITFAACMFCY